MNWFFSIRTKLFALVFSVSFAMIVAIYWQIGSKAKSVADNVVNRSLAQSSHIMDTRIASRFLFIREIASGIANDGRVRPFIYDEQSLTLQDLSLEYQKVYEFDSLFFLNAGGTILARSDQPQSIGANVSGRTSLFDDALNGAVSSGFFSTQGKLMQAVVTPVYDNVATDLVKGAVVLAYELSPDMASEILDLTQSHIGFYTFTRQLLEGSQQIDGLESSYLTDASLLAPLDEYFRTHPQVWNALTTLPIAPLQNGKVINDVLQIDMTLNDVLMHATLKPIASKDNLPLGFVVSLQSDTQLRQPFEYIRDTILIDGVISLILASLVAGLMAIGMSRPIIRLVDMIRLIQNGVYPDDSYQTGAKDEVGILHNAVVQMGQSLREKAELEAYLADLADEVVDESSFPMQVTQEGAELLEDTDETVIQLSSLTNETIIDNRFSLMRELGTGAMGTVYLASDLELNEKLAIKVIDKALFESLEGFNFKEEIRLARKITHRNIVRTFDFGNWGDKMYISMEYVDGYDLGKLIAKKGAFDLNIGLALCKQVCSAMISAHQMGIIHRDLKPANMIINRQGILKIMDFGLAMQVQSVVSGPSELDHEHSQSGTYIMGTPRYMAPEQFTINAELDARTDIYSIGLIMFTIFNGKPPYKGKNLKDIARLHQTAPIPTMDNCKKPIPQGVTDIIHKALAKNPDDRFQSVKEVYEALTNTP